MKIAGLFAKLIMRKFDRCRQENGRRIRVKITLELVKATDNLADRLNRVLSETTKQQPTEKVVVAVDFSCTTAVQRKLNKFPEFDPQAVVGQLHIFEGIYLFFSLIYRNEVDSDTETTNQTETTYH